MFRRKRTGSVRASTPADRADWPRMFRAYLLNDCSASMYHEQYFPGVSVEETPIAHLEATIGAAFHALYDEQGTTVLLGARVAVTAFSDTFDELLPLRPMSEVQGVDLPRGGGTDLGTGFDGLRKVIARDNADLIRDRYNTDYFPPVVYLLTDGKPTSEWVDARDRLVSQTNAKICAMGFGPDITESTLRQIASTSSGQLMAFKARPEVDAMELIQTIVQAVAKSVAQSASEGRFVFDVPEGWEALG